MLPPSVVDHLRRRLAIEFAEMDEQHARELSKAAAQHAARGNLNSGNACVAAVDQTRLELRRRAELMLRHLLRASAVFQATEVEGLADSAMELLGEVLQQHASMIMLAVEPTIPACTTL